MSPTSRKAQQLARQTAELGFAAPQVVALRLARMAQAGLRPSEADQREFVRMGAEKVAAFLESWQAMGWYALQLQQQWLHHWSMPATNPWLWWQPLAETATLPQQWQHAVLDMADRGLQPVRRRAVANARRLGSSRPRARRG